MPRVFLTALKLGLSTSPGVFSPSSVGPDVHVFESIIRSRLARVYTCVQYWSAVMLWTSTVDAAPRATHLTWVSGLVTLLERKERRPELAHQPRGSRAQCAFMTRPRRRATSPTPPSRILTWFSSSLPVSFHFQHASFVCTDIFGFEEHEHDGESAPLLPQQTVVVTARLF